MFLLSFYLFEFKIILKNLRIHKQVVQSAYDIIALKGYTSWAIGLSVSTICQSILRNEKKVCALSTLITKWNEAEKLGIKDEVFLSVPCVVGREGIVSLITQNLNSFEEDKLMNSIKTLHEVQKDIKL